MKKWILFISCCFLLAGCNNKEDVLSLENEIADLKQQLESINKEKITLATNIKQLEEIIDEYEKYKSVDRPSDDYIGMLQGSINMTLDFIEAINKKDYDRIDSFLASNALLNKEANTIDFSLTSGKFTINLNSYNYPLEEFNYRGGGFGNTKESFFLTFAFLGGEGHQTYNIEVEVSFIKENNEWKIYSFLS